VRQARSPGSFQQDVLKPEDPATWLINLQKPNIFGLENETGQPAGCKGSCVDIDPIWENIWSFDRRVTVDDFLAKIASMFKEFVADPKQVRLDLILKRYQRSNASVYEEVVSGCVGRDQRPEKGHMLVW
jgi:hypothetical protein